MRSKVRSIVCYWVKLRVGDGGRYGCAYASSDFLANVVAHCIADAVADAIVRREDDGSVACGLHAERRVRSTTGLQLQRVGCTWIQRAIVDARYERDAGYVCAYSGNVAGG